MKKNVHIDCLLFILFMVLNIGVYGQYKEKPILENPVLQLAWSQTNRGYELTKLRTAIGNTWYSFSEPLGAYTVLYSAEKPDTSTQTISDVGGVPIHFPEPEYRYVTGKWKNATSSVSLNRAGEAFNFYPSSFHKKNGALEFAGKNEVSTIKSRWQFDPVYQNDIQIEITVTALQSGYFSIATPTLVKEDLHQFTWAVIPGIFQGQEINPDFVDAYAYGHGIPHLPVVVRERTASSLTSILTNKKGISLAVTADPGTGRDPWLDSRSTQGDWLLGLSSLNRQGDLMPTLYHPVLGEKKSYLRKGESISFSFRYTIKNDNWYEVNKHVINDIYSFSDFLSLKSTKESLSHRLLRLFNYVRNDSTSRWRTFDYNGMTIGAQEYLGGVHDSDKDAIKNADYGAMWMLANMTKDPVLNAQRLPYALNFKKAQQNLKDPFFYGAAAGQYYLHKSRRFTEEWGAYSEPIATTYYLMIDIGNILLFEPGHEELRSELSKAADWLLDKINKDGRWEVAYDNHSNQPIFQDLQDYRPTFYGLLVAYRILKDKKYLDAAIQGADWLLKNAVNKGYFLGVCGDTRFAPDFATIQAAEAFMDLYELTNDQKYKDAVIRIAQFYTTSIYTHPVPGTTKKNVKGAQVFDWQISQVGLSFEHGGTIGSANSHGPILLASHAGMFVRLFQVTADSLYLDMARAAAWGRDAFVDPKTGVASYYWNAMNNGAGPFPHHAWWQIGWITDYLLAEAHLRSDGQITFPSGFMAPKVGPHKTYGFARGQLFGASVDLAFQKEEIRIDNPSIDYIVAVDSRNRQDYIVLLNNSVVGQEIDVQSILTTTPYYAGRSFHRVEIINEKGQVDEVWSGQTKKHVKIPATGIKTVKVEWK